MAKKPQPDLEAIDRAMAKPLRTKEETRLRDEFAMAALPAVYASYLMTNDQPQMAREAYEIADAMLTARQS